MSFDINKIGERIKKFCELRNYTQESLAVKLDMTPQGYGKIERNEVEVSLTKLSKIADLLNTTIQDILGFEDRFVFHNQECQQQNVSYNQAINFKEIQSIYEERISDLKAEINRLHNLLAESLKR
ncbi:MAG: hypothetical protein OHK0053_08770 [Microscillaceae bacterium]